MCRVPLPPRTQPGAESRADPMKGFRPVPPTGGPSIGKPLSPTNHKPPPKPQGPPDLMRAAIGAAVGGSLAWSVGVRVLPTAVKVYDAVKKYGPKIAPLRELRGDERIPEDRILREKKEKTEKELKKLKEQLEQMERTPVSRPASGLSSLDRKRQK